MFVLQRTTVLFSQVGRDRDCWFWLRMVEALVDPWHVDVRAEICMLEPSGIEKDLWKNGRSLPIAGRQY